MIRPRWVWQMLDAGGTVLEEPLSPVFTTQYDAEQWLGEQWRDLASQGVTEAGLLHDGAQAVPAVRLSTDLP